MTWHRTKTKMRKTRSCALFLWSDIAASVAYCVVRDMAVVANPPCSVMCAGTPFSSTSDRLRRRVPPARLLRCHASLDSLFGPSVDLLGQRAVLRAKLLSLIAPTERGATASKAQRAVIDAAARELESRCPVSETLRVAEGLWELFYTTETDVHAFRPLGYLSVSQELQLQALRVTNRIETRLIRLEAEAPAKLTLPRRVSYRFSRLAVAVGPLSLALNLGDRGPGGWSDTVYVDDELRIARNSRRDLLILARTE